MSVKLDERYDLYIGGKWVPASDGRTFATINPANGEKLADCAEATKEDVDAAVQAAWAAFPAWRDLGTGARAAILDKIADVIDENAELLATVESMDNGKPIRETMAIDVPYSSDHFRYFAGAIRTEEGKASVLDGNMMSLILREPIGVVGQIVPWNFPFLMAAILKCAQGSSTVAITTTAGIVAPMLPALGLNTPILGALTVIAIGAGAMTVSHANDSYFWVVTNFGEMTVSDGYKTHTIGTLVIGVTSMICVFLAWLFLH